MKHQGTKNMNIEHNLRQFFVRDSSLISKHDLNKIFRQFSQSKWWERFLNDLLIPFTNDLSCRIVCWTLYSEQSSKSMENATKKNKKWFWCCALHILITIFDRSTNNKLLFDSPFEMVIMQRQCLLLSVSTNSRHTTDDFFLIRQFIYIIYNVIVYLFFVQFRFPTEKIKSSFHTKTTLSKERQHQQHQQHQWHSNG